MSTVNGWIEDKTHDKIKDMLESLSPDLAMLLINAVYFNGTWKYAFDKADTRDEKIYAASSTPISVPMMHQTVELKTARSNNLTLAELPYGQGNYNMVVVLPDENISTTDVANSLNPLLWQEWMELLSVNEHETDLRMPRFKYKYKRPLKDDLIELIMGIAFSDFADFSNISDPDLVISRVLHQTFIETNEEGTEAAAATVVEMELTSAGPYVGNVTIDHPFLYFIRES